MYKNILIATDGSELAGKGLEHGLQLAKSLSAAVTVITVSDPWVLYGLADYTQFDALAEAAESTANDILDAAKKGADTAGVPCKTVYEPQRYPADAIVEYASANSIDLIVMASHGRRGLQRILLGSQATQVLALTSIPVLIVK